MNNLRVSSSFAAAVALLACPLFDQTAFGQAVTPRAAARFADQAAWGPTPALIAQIQSMGFAAWLKAQYALKTSDLPDQPILDSAGNSNSNLAPVQAAFYENTVANQDQLRQRVAFILSQIWVVSQSAVTNAYAYPPYWRICRDNAFGNYSSVIKAITLSPAMGRFLNMANNNKANAANGTAANENYARELMQLFTLGLTQLNADGSPLLDSNKVPEPTYTTAIVTEMARILTGWTYPTAPGAKVQTNNPEYFIGQMFAVDAEHDKTAKPIFGGVTIPANQTAEQDLDELIAALLKQPTMAPFVSQQLIEHLVTSNPSPAYVTRISKIFENDGTGVTGNLQAVITAILTDSEARAGDTASAAEPASYGHMREPILLMANALRGLNATVTAPSTISGDASEMGENLFNSGSVFSYFSPQNRTALGLLGPEFQIYSTQTAADRINLIYSILYGTGVTGFKVNLAPFVAQAGTPAALLTYISSVFLHDGMSTSLQQAATAAMTTATTPTAKVQAALYVVLTSAEYQIVQ